ncbi:Small-conductance mechanosensitive channel [Sphingomonas laterariae]|uniref:Small-conductance mechanosensitive channel n=1 Tax=Edaphosphingomonas laterariae TaxID=861865 RepID=A0A239H2X6_9SPHN|nr:mechanosensitive ion channel domain-containing protein [Sphingomonas laterariae]SNS75143.1 Small-conductance mechanosensitive channel [Sphingomonas laterariae]
MPQSNSTATPPAADKTPYADKVERLWTDSYGWVVSHSTQILIGVAIAAVIVLALLGLKRFGIHLCRDRENRGHWAFILGRALARTRLWFMVAVALQLVSAYADAPGFVSGTASFLFTIASVLQVAIWARVLILGLVEHRSVGASAEDAAAIGSAMNIIRLLVTVAVFAIATIVILDNLGVNVTGLVAGLGIGGIAIGLAAQGIFSDLFAALSILFDKPFQRGEGIRFDQTTGTVETIGLKSTRIRSTTGEQIVISNANLLNKELRNFDRLDHRRMIHRFGVTYQTTPEVLEAIPSMIKKIVLAHPKCTFLRCGMAAYGASSLDFELQYDIHSEDFEEVFTTNHRVMIAILKRFNDDGIEFAYPTQTTFTAAPDGTLVMPYAEPAAPKAKATPAA